MDHDVFISHAPEDNSIAVAICKKLQSARIRCWMPTPDASSDEDWTKAAWKAIGSSSVILLILSENAHAAPHIKREIVYAYYSKRVIIPLRLNDTPARNEFLFYLSNVRWFDVSNPPAEEQLEGLVAHIKSLIPLAAISPKGAGKTTATWNFLNSRIGALRASNYRTVEILKWAAIAASLVAFGGLMWMALREPNEEPSLAERHSIHPDSTASPKPSLQAGGGAPSPAATHNFMSLGLWQPPIAGATPFVQEEAQVAPEAQVAQVAPVTAPAEGSESVTPSPPPAEVTQGERAGPTSTVESHARLLPPTGTHQGSHHHYQAYPGTRTLEAQKNAALVTRQRNALERQLKEIEAQLQATQKSLDILVIQRDELQRQLEESEAMAQTAQKNADIATSERDALRNQLRETENRAITAEKNGELASSQLNLLQKQLKESETKARAAQDDGDIARSQRDALQSQLTETEAEAQTAQKNADLATRQQNALEGQLRKAQGENARLVQQNADLDVSHNSASKTQSRREQEDTHPANTVAELAENQPETGQTQPPNPDRNAKPAPLTKELDSPAPSGLP